MRVNNSTIAGYIGKDIDQILEDRRSLHDQNSELAAICDSKMVSKTLDSLEASLVIEYMNKTPGLAFNKAQAMAIADSRYKDKLQYYEDKIREHKKVEQDYWIKQDEFAYAMKLIDFMKQETYIMNKGNQ